MTETHHAEIRTAAGNRDISRRGFVRTAALALGTAAGAIALAGCSTGSGTSSTATSAASTAASAAAATATSAAGSPSAQASSGRVLLAYFSRAGENYSSHGSVTLDVGNTKVIAEFIESALNCDTYEIVPATVYPTSYDETLTVAQSEIDQNARPAIYSAATMPTLANYDTVLLGSPIWWGESPMIMRTFLETAGANAATGAGASANANITIVPFTTHGGSGLGSVAANYAGCCPGATVSNRGLAILGEQATSSETAVRSWLSGLGLLA